MKLDHIDLKILGMLQEDATTPIARIADRVGLSQTPCWKRIQKYEQAGIIARRVAVLDAAALGLGLTVFVCLSAAEQGVEWRSGFLEAVSRYDAVQDIHRLAGDHDYLLRVVVPDMAAYDAFLTGLTAEVRFRATNAFFVLESVRSTCAIPLASLSGAAIRETADHRTRRDV
jgi:Lrp/AsnC family transcriptional regulator